MKLERECDKCGGNGWYLLETEIPVRLAPLRTRIHCERCKGMSRLPADRIEVFMPMEPQPELCDTTQTFRLARDCDCPTYEENLGPCWTWELGGNGRCVYCDHKQKCHDDALPHQPGDVVRVQNEGRPALGWSDALGCMMDGEWDDYKLTVIAIDVDVEQRECEECVNGMVTVIAYVGAFPYKEGDYCPACKGTGKVWGWKIELEMR